MTVLESEINQAVKYLQKLNISQQSVAFQIQALNVDLYKLKQFREQLGQAIHFYQSSGDEFYNKIQTPSEFFVQMQQHHEKVLAMFEQKVKEAEAIVSALVQEGSKGNKPKDYKEMKKQIFEICKLIYDEQRVAAA